MGSGLGSTTRTKAVDFYKVLPGKATPESIKPIGVSASRVSAGKLMK
jgi:hypothetical protein